MSARDRIRGLLPAAIGARFERSTESHLKRNGLRTICHNYRCRGGEIDLVMEDGDTIVFIEVRYRSTDDYGDPFETITQRKQQRIIRAATHFLGKNANYRDRPCRFDAVGVNGIGERVKYDWIKGAFST
jgi:putative endonuclease